MTKEVDTGAKKSSYASAFDIIQHPFNQSESLENLVGTKMFGDTIPIQSQFTRVADAGPARGVLSDATAGRDMTVTPPGRIGPDGQAIPDVLRPLLKPGAELGPDKLDDFGAKYVDSVSKLYELPRTYQGKEGDTFKSLAAQTLKDRSQITGERVNDSNVDKETKRLQDLNPGVTDLNGQPITTYSKADLARIATTEAVFSKTPPAGQFFKLANPDLNEPDIKRALDLQKSNGNLKLGEILQDQNLMGPGFHTMTKEQVGTALGAQEGWKTFLKNIYKEISPMLDK